jgi:ABC-2 type transport system permease protein
MLHAFVEPNLGGLGGCIYSGALDDALLQPAPALFTVSLSRCDPWALLSALSGVVVIGAQLSRTGFDLATLPAFIALLSCSLVLMWATRTALALLPFWSPGADLDVLFWALWQSGKFPVSVYHPAVQRLLTVAIPVGLISALPARALSGVTDLATVLGALGACVVAVVVVLTLWRLALRRYTSATS